MGKKFNIEADSTNKGNTQVYFQEYDGNNLINELPIKNFKGNLKNGFTNIEFLSRKKAEETAKKIMKIKTINQLKKVI